MICQKSEIRKQHYNLALLNLLVSTLILLVAVVWTAKGRDFTSAAHRPDLSSSPTQSGESGLSQEELLLQAKLFLNGLKNELKLGCAVVIVLPREGIVASRSDCARAPGERWEPAKAEELPFTLTVMAATPESDDPLQPVSEGPAGYIEL
jgi:hypothetical protein